MLVVCVELSFFFSNFIAPLIISFAIDDPVSVFIMGDELSVNHDHLKALLIVLTMFSIFSNLYSVSILIVFDGIIVGVILDKVAMMVKLLFFPFTFLHHLFLTLFTNVLFRAYFVVLRVIL